MLRRQRSVNVWCLYQVLTGHGLSEFGAILIHKHFSCSEGQVQMTRKITTTTSKDGQVEMYEAKPTNVTGLDLEHLIPFKWRLVVKACRDPTTEQERIGLRMSDEKKKGFVRWFLATAV